ncbi:unnamed protein product [Protopolystoma xenopodis]|uniref:Protein kinase domain-containing protein n=1 Tax=Protopolystoma xenopodis TaxID=117903 RepID=A0A3S5APT3_9PLAT|nr:unnamed protein product [Protopolystoma xenopodis]
MSFVGAHLFDIKRFIGSGCHSVVFEAVKKDGLDANTKYALKRFFLDNQSAFRCVQRERRILERLAKLDHQCAFLPVLFYSFCQQGVFVFVLREGCGRDMYDLIRHTGSLSESDARFYLCEIICALEHIHSLNIVHLDVKPENVLCAFDGHTFLSDFDRSLDLSSIKGAPTADDFTGTPLFMAPEIAKGEAITIKADIWSLAVLAAEMLSGPIRPSALDVNEEFRQAREGRFTIKRLKTLTKPLQSFFSACLQRQHAHRPDIHGVKRLRFLKFIDWDKVHSGALKPPYNPADIRHRPAKEDRFILSSTDPHLLSNAYSLTRMLALDPDHAKKVSDIGSSSVSDTHVFEIPSFLKGVSEGDFNNLMTQFYFVHPRLQTQITSVVSQSSYFHVQEAPRPLDSCMTEKIERRRSRTISMGD